LLAGLQDGLALRHQHIRFTELVNDLFGVVSFPWHGSDLLNWLFTTLDLDQEDGARSITGKEFMPYQRAYADHG
jgi:hypothetical protein